MLKGADFQKKLVARTHDGIEIQPLYPKAEGSAPVAREQAGRWRVSQRVDHPDPAKANELALLDLEGGADALDARHSPGARPRAASASGSTTSRISTGRSPA